MAPLMTSKSPKSFAGKITRPIGVAYRFEVCVNRIVVFVLDVATLPYRGKRPVCAFIYGVRLEANLNLAASALDTGNRIATLAV